MSERCSMNFSRKRRARNGSKNCCFQSIPVSSKQAKLVRRARERKRAKSISQTRPKTISSMSRMRFRDFERIRQNRHVGLKPDIHRHGTLDDEREALRTLESQTLATSIDS
jgi:hypothetical protein